MKKYLLLFILCNVRFIYAQTPSTCNIPQQLADGYYKDVKHLAVFNLFQTFSPDTALVRIPQSAIDPILEGMAAILNAPIAESDSVFNLYCVHNFNGWPYDYAGFLVAVDTNYSWTQSWQNLNTITGDPLMDTILTRYNLHLTSFYNWSFGNYALLETDSAWNPNALIDTFQLVPGVLSAEQNYFIGNAGTITYTDNGTDRVYEFYYEFNDCFDGCDNYRKWTFKVYPNCSVDYLGFVDYGVFGILPLPSPVNCNLFTNVHNPDLQQNMISIYPSPAENFITVNLSSELKSSFYSAIDISGRQVKEGSVSGLKTFIDIHDLPDGIYQLRIKDGGNHYTKTFIRSGR